MKALYLSDGAKDFLTVTLAIYIAAVSIASVIACCADKINAKKHGKRVSESDLLLLSALGGGASMFITMLIIRHKTKKPKFMIGIPLIILLHLITAALILL